LELRDRKTGADAMPELSRRTDRLPPLTARLFRETGFMLMPGDGHIRDFLEPVAETPRDEHFAHGSGDERQARLEMLKAVAENRAPYEPLFEHESWEKPVDMVAARSGNGTASFEALNLPNTGQLPGIPDGVYVETSATADTSGVKTETIRLPEKPLALCQRTARVTTLIAHATRERSLKRLREAVEADPVIVDKSAGWRALQGCLEAHADVLPKMQ
jgi:alpha-galactosidase/6-phospho-beta-glucosidase family protein